ncbi:MAG: M3 family metallopeptidase, partial [Longimicrobiales bacterium]
GLRDFRLSGIGLPAGPRARFKDIQQELCRLETKFEENLLDATHAWTCHVPDVGTLQGLPDPVLALAAHQARQRDRVGWLLTLDFAMYLPVMQHAEDETLRREMYEAYVTRASDQGPNAGKWDNSGLMIDILALRRELAALLGYGSYAEVSLVRKMARSPAEVLGFMQDLARRSRSVAEVEFAELKDFTRTHYGVTELNAWDVAFYSEKLRRQRFDFSDEDLRPYFPLPSVLHGMFEVVRRLYGVRVAERSGVDAWHPDVRFFELRDANGLPRGAFYLDACARAGKRSGAWMNDCVTRRRIGARVQKPVAFLVCNFMPPVDDRPSLLTHDEVMTLFHEFGHGLH